MDNNGTRQVSIVDINVPFGSMVVFMIKAGLAAIPAMIILYLIYIIMMPILLGILGVVAGI